MWSFFGATVINGRKTGSVNIIVLHGLETLRFFTFVRTRVKAFWEVNGIARIQTALSCVLKESSKSP